MSTDDSSPDELDRVVEVSNRLDRLADDLDGRDDVAPDDVAMLRGVSDLVTDFSDRLNAVEDFLEENRTGVLKAQALTKKTVVTESYLDELEEERVADGETVAQATVIQQFAAAPPEERDSLGPSDRRAAFIVENWTDWASHTPKGQVLTTATDQTGKAKLKTLLENALAAHGYDEDGLAWNEVYRAMKTVAKKSGGSSGSVTDGAWKYVPDWNDPWGESGSTCKMLLLQDPDMLRQTDD